MTIKEVKAYLLQVQKLNRLIKSKKEDIDQLRNIAEGVTIQSDSEKVSSSGKKQKMSDAVCEYVDIQQELLNEFTEYVRLKREIIKLIKQLEINEFNVIYEFYINGKEYYEIAEKLGKSYSWVTSKHGTGLLKLQKILNGRVQNETCQETKAEERQKGVQ